MQNEFAAVADALVQEHLEPVLRLVLATVLGGLIGLEREASGKAAGFRTNLLICLGAALITGLSIGVAENGTLPGGLRSDPGRIAAQIVSGIGFIGAGTIMQARGSITGLTTAATMWVVAGVGMAAGAGAYVSALAGTALVMIALRTLGAVEHLVLPRRTEDRTVRVVLDPDPGLITEVEHTMTEAGFRLVHLEIEHTAEGISAAFSTRGRPGDLYDIVGRLLAQRGVRKVTLM